MSNESNFKEAKELISNGKWIEAIPLLRKELELNANNDNTWYLLGLCYRFTNQLEMAVTSLHRAISLDASIPSYYLALGIAYQLLEKYEESLSSLRIANKLDNNYVEAFISAAITLKKMKNYTKSLEIFDEAANALTRQFVKNNPNNSSAKIYGFRNTKGTLWIKYTINAVMYDIATSNIDGIMFPTSEFVENEYLHRRHGGLFWEDENNVDTKTMRKIYPNFLDSVREYLILDRRYSNIIRNKGSVLEILNNNEEAKLHFNEANEFIYLCHSS